MRGLGSVVLLVLGALMVPVATAGWWMSGTLVPRAEYVETVAPLAQDPEVQDAVARRLSAEVLAVIEEKGIVEEAAAALDQGDLPPAVVAGLRSQQGELPVRIERLVRSAVGDVVQSPALAEAWRIANREAHDESVAILSGDSDAVDVRRGDQVEIRLARLSNPVVLALIEAGVPFADTIPRVQASFTIGTVQDLRRAQLAYTALDRWGRLLPLVAGLLLALGLVAARSRRRGLIGACLLSLLGLGLLAIGVVVAREVYLAKLPSAVPSAAAQAFYDVLARGLWRDMAWVAGVAAVLLLLALVVRRPARSGDL